MWSLTAYNALPLLKKFKVAHKFGEFLAERSYSGYKIQLYQVNHFYVEVWFNLLQHQLFHIEGFRDLEKLDTHYLSEADISQLLPDD